MNLKNNSFLFKKDKESWFLFKEPVEVLVEYGSDGILTTLEYIESRISEGFYAAGFLSYESSKGFDTDFRVNKNSISPDLWFGIYGKPEIISHSDLMKGDGETLDLKWNIPLNDDQYRKGMAFIKDVIEKGDIYQLNYTFMMDSEFTGNPFEIFKSTFANLDSKYSAFLETEDFAVLSGSPELFFSLNGDEIISKPMKGTFPRGRTPEEDRNNEISLFFSQKDRAENIMIVDMIRNDLGKIAKTSSVKVDKLFEIETYSRVLQMTSTVSAKTDSSVPDIFKAMFPCASITGAPKIKAMEHINHIEKGERGIYTGSIGYIGPDREALFNVAIRTLLINKGKGRACYGTGGGIVWDSETDNEFQECMNKALIISNPEPEFHLLETMLYTPENGFYLLDYHLKRLYGSSEYFGFSVDLPRVEDVLLKFKSKDILRVRLLCDRCGEISLETSKLDSNPLEKKTRWRVQIAEESIDSNNRFLFHKTTNRSIYEEILSAHKSYDDVILRNEKNEITESCFANIVIEQGSKLYTPPVSCGLLNGTMRSKLIKEKRIFEKIIFPEDIYKSDRVYLINSVRGFIDLVIER